MLAGIEVKGGEQGSKKGDWEHGWGSVLVGQPRRPVKGVKVREQGKKVK